jgi:hypothetical protein
MKYASPVPIRKTDEARLCRVVSEIIGRRLARVHYRYPHGTSWPNDYPYGHGAIDEVGMAAVADFDDGSSLIVSWAMEGMSGGLDVATGPTAAIASVPEYETEFDVTDMTNWRAVLGRRVEKVAAAWHISGLARLDPPEYPETLWAVRIGFSGGGKVVVALGAVEQAGVRYQPDSLIVLFKPEDVRAYIDEGESPFAPIAT